MNVDEIEAGSQRRNRAQLRTDMILLVNEGRYVGDVGGNGRNPVGCRQCEHKKPHDNILGSGKTSRARHPTTQHQGVRNVLKDVDTLVR